MAGTLSVDSSSPPIELFKSFYSRQYAEKLFSQLLTQHQWPDNTYRVANRCFTLPRQQSWHADRGIVYSYSNNLLHTRPWTPLLAGVREKVQDFLAAAFNAVLVNLYRDGDDYVGWHADNEKELGPQPLIASVTLGAERLFSYRHNQSGREGSIVLGNGSLLVMQPSFQHHWQHAVPLCPGLTASRINLTFRNVIAPNNSQ